MTDEIASQLRRVGSIAVLAGGLALATASSAVGWQPPAPEAAAASSGSTVFWVVGLLLAAVGIAPGIAVGYGLSRQWLTRCYGPADSEAGKGAQQRFGVAATVFAMCVTCAGLAGAMVLAVISVLADGDPASGAATGFCFNVALCLLAPLVAWLVGQSGA